MKSHITASGETSVLLANQSPIASEAYLLNEESHYRLQARFRTTPVAITNQSPVASEVISDRSEFTKLVELKDFNGGIGVNAGQAFKKEDDDEKQKAVNTMAFCGGATRLCGLRASSSSFSYQQQAMCHQVQIRRKMIAEIAVFKLNDDSKIRFLRVSSGHGLKPHVYQQAIFLQVLTQREEAAERAVFELNEDQKTGTEEELKLENGILRRNLLRPTNDTISMPYFNFLQLPTTSHVPSSRRYPKALSSKRTIILSEDTVFAHLILPWFKNTSPSQKLSFKKPLLASFSTSSAYWAFKGTQALTQPVEAVEIASFFKENDVRITVALRSPRCPAYSPSDSYAAQICKQTSHRDIITYLRRTSIRQSDARELVVENVYFSQRLLFEAKATKLQTRYNKLQTELTITLSEVCLLC
ncbi:hypothetical protein K440DRAFT_643886 [Wilcoxina mikolae CBS 423.85]|nr:hypothetical protein K440DRAFT_643886 [Wilcoxina mikolae CBS 423.85]